MAKGLLVNYRWCSGCHSCELACQMENGLPAGQYGIKVLELGPWQYGPKDFVLENIPVLTAQCHLCGKRLAAGKLPSCVQHCQANCIQVVDAEEGAALAAANPKTLFMRI